MSIILPTNDIKIVKCLDCNKDLDKKGRNKYARCCRCVNKMLKLGSNNSQWRCDSVGYRAVHSWMQRHFGKANRCDDCNDINSKRYEWANISGKYKRDLSDWKMNCSSCHIKYHRRNFEWNKESHRNRKRDIYGRYAKV